MEKEKEVVSRCNAMRIAPRERSGQHRGIEQLDDPGPCTYRQRCEMSLVRVEHFYDWRIRLMERVK